MSIFASLDGEMRLSCPKQPVQVPQLGKAAEPDFSLGLDDLRWNETLSTTMEVTEQKNQTLAGSHKVFLRLVPAFEVSELGACWLDSPWGMYVNFSSLTDHLVSCS